MIPGRIALVKENSQMPRIRHLVLSCEDNEAAAEFYKRVFGMVEVSRRPNKQDPDVFHLTLSDGHISLALEPGIVGNPEGLNHFGFQVEDVDSVVNAALTLGVKPGNGLIRHEESEAVMIDPTGTKVEARTGDWLQATPEQVAEAKRTLALS
jgi:catechol 2,3-dioxygenase-like lactoylglutathione lyase family enzyme